MWDLKEPTHYSKRVGHEVHGVVAVLAFVTELAQVIYLAWNLGPHSYVTFHFCEKAVEKKKYSICFLGEAVSSFSRIDRKFVSPNIHS